VTLDPTLLLDARRWERALPCRRLVDTPYLFAYFLGPAQEHRRAARRLSEALGVRIVALRHLDEYVPEDETFGDDAPYDIDPADFVNLVRYADYVCTDSFHGSVFSLLHHKRFIVFDRYAKNAAASTNSRIDSLCAALALSGRRFRGEGSLTEDMLRPVDYDEVDKKLAALRASSLGYLERALAGLREE